ncbi:hypothetical protein [Microbacterium sp. PMB16]|uniref:hypothetical protein n=1 Tax=Microbacterium sp. PMB16 TaxID=3120157 RepID=UPI003F4BAD14
MPGTAPPEWTQIDLTSRRGGTGQRITAVILAVVGVAGFATSFRSLGPWWWEFALMAFGCAVIVLLAAGLWINAGTSVASTVTLKETGTPVALPVVAAFETTDEGLRYQLQLRLPTAEEEYVVHACGDPRCVAAGRAAPDAELPVLLDASKKTWAVVHGAQGA